MSDYHNYGGRDFRGNRANSYSRQNQKHNNPQSESIKVPDLNEKELLGSIAEKLAKGIIVNSIIEEIKLTTTQLRNFYGEFKSIERLLDASVKKEEDWDNLYPRIKLIKAKAYYNAARETGKISNSYKNFLGQCVDKVESDYEAGSKSFKKVCQLFEAVVGYASADIRYK